MSLLLNAVAPSISGVLIRGQKGTAKSTAARALAALLPRIDVIDGCRFNCDPAASDATCPDGPHAPDASYSDRPVPLVELPVGATTDRLAGTIDLEQALADGRRAFEPGLLAAANRGILYVDEANLLGDHLVDLLLDAAALGTNHVEREGISVQHTARFILIGTMNPEEGELRPQLLDRFGLTVEVSGNDAPQERIQVVRRRLAYEADPAAFASRWADEETALRDRVVASRARVGSVLLEDDQLDAVVTLCASFGVDGLRADIVMAKTASAIAAWEGRDLVTTEDVRRAARLVLPHRRRRGPLESPGIDDADIDDALQNDEEPDPEPDPPSGGPGQRPEGDSSESGGPEPELAPVGAGGDGQEASGGRAPEAQVDASGEAFVPVLLEVAGKGTGALGRRSRAESWLGNPVSDRRNEGSGVAIVPTVRSSAPSRVARRAAGRALVQADDLRFQIREGREGNLILFVVDASGSMAARQRMVATKAAVLSLLLDAYQRRDRVGVVTFRGSAAGLVLAATSSVERAAKELDLIETGGRTPIAEGLERAAEVLRIEAIRDPKRRPLVVLLTDGRATSGDRAVERAQEAARGLARRGVAVVVVDTEDGNIRLGLAREMAAQAGWPTVRLEDLGGDGLARTIQLMQGRAA